ncbi:SAICAR synthase-like protein [Tilletiaria anomala UBC 951]|uniref:Phosphoribosylaminoimidazole-succinocarboxamide synthase n=1 Tax=Tilletiaria anomala (strain ATCC 24038 / CBS 436.72 / UBC 951) TaxID=1037660 RepID=A0A066VP18_TILAU|nr:SAICAR synthase-like protein [Tilletiaria anomala UBC 951]KDN43211.1 SAICAR synthase-like protein [Tilletiaria anomala UBC 951]
MTPTMPAIEVLQSALPLPLIARGKVRDVYDAEIIAPADTSAPGAAEETAAAGSILFVASDRISAFDIILANGIPGKGQLLNRLSAFWFRLLTSEADGVIPSHVLFTSSSKFPPSLVQRLSQASTMPSKPALPALEQVRGRSMLVRRARILPIEAIVRGYLTGSGWAEYQKHGTVHGLAMPKSMQESQEIPGGPIFTPSTKAEQGEHDENIHPDKVADIIGPELAQHMAKVAVDLYKTAAEHARTRGIILADTKFEFGMVPTASLPAASALVKRQPTFKNKETGEEETMILVDEVLTPDSSRFWGAAEYQVGKSQASFDKQFVRDWLKKEGLVGPNKEVQEGKEIRLPEDVVKATLERYEQAYDMITGERFVVGED